PDTRARNVFLLSRCLMVSSSRWCGHGAAGTGGSSRSGDQDMPKKKSGTAYSVRDLARKAARGEDRTDWTRASRMTRARIEKAVAGDPDEAGMIVEWAK